MRREMILLFIVSVFTATAALADGLSVNLPLIGRVTGGGGVLFRTAVDVTNNSATAVSVDFYFDGSASSGDTISIEGTITDLGIVPRSVGTMGGASSQHFDDFADALVQAGLMPASVRDAGVTGSVLFVFDGLTKSGQGSVTARFYNDFGGGSVGVSLKGHEIAANEPQKLVATLRDTGGTAGAAPTYPNLFINNTGLAPDGSNAPTPVTVRVSAVSSKTSQPVGNAATYTIGPGQVINLGHTFQILGVDNTKESGIIVTVAVTSGTAAIEGLVSQVDAITKDGSAFEMSRADF